MLYSTRQLKKILYIEDDEGLARLLQIRMERFGYEIDIAPSAEDGLEKMKHNTYDMVLLDNYLPGINGVDFLKSLSLGELDTPYIFLTSSGDEKLAIDALRANATDYMVKDTGQTYLELLPSVMAAAHTKIELIRQTKRQEETLRKYAEKIATSEQRLNLALEGTQTGVWDWDLKTGELFWSDNLKTNYGLHADEQPNIEFWLSKIHPEDKQNVQLAIKEHLNGKAKFYHCIFREKAREGSSREWNWILARGLAQFNEKGEAYRVIGTSSDFTIHKKLEEQLENAKNKAEEASRSKSEFLATMSHEIRTPMNAIIGLSDILAKSVLNPRQQEMVDTIISSSSNLLALINDLLDISRIEANQMKMEILPVNLCVLVTEITNLLSSTAKTKGLDFDVDCVSLKDKHFLADKLRLSQIITNLCGNAIKFTQKGKIDIAAHCERVNGDNFTVKIIVKDSGIGIAQEKLTTIFEKFVQADQSITRKFGGSGLGLTISRSLAQQMGGDITAESIEGKGSLFTLTLPLKITELPLAEAEKPDSKKAKKVKQKPDILLVEDYQPNILVASLLLDSMGYRFDVANSGLEAVEKVSAKPNAFGVILMDIQMHEMDGFEATKTIRKLEKKNGWNKHMIIGLTAHALAGDREKCLDAGMDEYTTKPINSRELEDKIIMLSKES